jgi:hypothetical protein
MKNKSDKSHNNSSNKNDISELEHALFSSDAEDISERDNEVVNYLKPLYKNYSFNPGWLDRAVEQFEDAIEERDQATPREQLELFEEMLDDEQESWTFCLNQNFKQCNRKIVSDFHTELLLGKS